ncbi:unnamed protein product [Rhodiola kirilowii]
MSNHKVVGSEPDKNDTGVIASLNTYQKRSPATAKKNALRDPSIGEFHLSQLKGPIQDTTENSVALEERAAKKNSVRDVGRRGEFHLSQLKGPIQNSTENSVVLEERANADSVIFAGSERSVPECCPSLPSSQLLSSSSSVSMTHQQDPIRRHGISFGPPPAGSMNFPSASPSVPVSLIKPVNPRTSIESNHKDYIERLLKMTPAQLSKHAVELEKRSMQLTREENREIQRKAALDINLTQPASGHDQDTPFTK